jgi:hypothetical protein
MARSLNIRTRRAAKRAEAGTETTARSVCFNCYRFVTSQRS